MSTDSGGRHHVPIAVCGYGYRLPGGLETDEDVWDLISNRRFVQELVDQRYGAGEIPWDGFNDSPVRIASPYEGLITGGKELTFDCSLFGISHNEAKRMDPQIKMMLMVTWDALQCAGISQSTLHNSSTGVFTGHQSSSISSWRSPRGATSGDVPGKSSSMIANRISYHFNWMGPSYSVETACSSGVTALDAAVKSLQRGDCDLAATGSVNYLGHICSSVGFNALGIISKTGTSRSFDKDANGYMRSEGAFMYILKRLPDAERDGDKIFGVIRSCGLNTAGAELDADVLTQGRMILAPAGHAQATLMKQVAQQANVHPTEVDYVEAHATGTSVGDKIEGNAIASVYGAAGRESPLRLGSTRSNLGHMEAASFGSSLLKVIIMLQKQHFLPVSSHFKSPNPEIPFEARTMVVQTDCESFGERTKPILVAINSFGFGGANGNCLIEQYRSPGIWSRLPGDLGSKVHMAPLSAKSDEALVENARSLSRCLVEVEKHSDFYTLIANLSVRMTHHRVRRAFTAASVPELRDTLDTFVQQADSGEIKADTIARLDRVTSVDGIDDELSPRIVMVFPGQGSQWTGCGRELYETELVFRRVVDTIDAEWIKLTGSKLSSVAFGEDEASVLDKCEWAQPVSFLLQVGLFEMLKAHGIHPSAVVGHSAGEVAAAYASGAYTLESACQLVYHRSQLQARLSGSGRMLVLMRDHTSVMKLLERFGLGDEIEIACMNSPNNTVVCGSNDAVELLRKKLESKGEPTGKLIPGEIAFHSRHMSPIRDLLVEATSELHGSKPVRSCILPMISTVTGSALSTLDSEYWWRNVREPVNLLAAMETIESRARPSAFLELSPHITLRSPIRDFYDGKGKAIPNYIYTLVRGTNAAYSFARSIGGCFEAGLPLSFRGLYPRPKPITHLLPSYFMKQEKIIDVLLDDKALQRKEFFSAGPLLGRATPGSNKRYEAIISKTHFSWMADHIVQDKSIVPAAAYVELLLEAFQGSPVHIVSARLLAPYVLSGESSYLHTDIRESSYASNRFEFKISSSSMSNLNKASKLHCAGFVETAIEQALPSDVPRTLSLVTGNFTDDFYPDGERFYAAMAARVGRYFSYGPFFRPINRIERDLRTQRLRVRISVDADDWTKWERMGYVIHPILLDGALQIFIAYIMEATDFSGVPQMIENFVFLRKPSSQNLTCVYDPPEYLRGNMHQKGQLALGLGERSAGTILIYDDASDELIAYIGQYTSFTTANTGSNNSELRKSKHFLSWQPKDDCNADSVSVPAIDALVAGSSLGTVGQLLMDEMIRSAHPERGTPFFLNVAECVLGQPPEKLLMEECMTTITDAPIQYMILSSDEDFLVAGYQRLANVNQDANLRFIKTDDPSMRPAMFELLIIRAAESKDEESMCELIGLVSPGGLVLVESSGTSIHIPTNLICLRPAVDADHPQEPDISQINLFKVDNSRNDEQARIPVSPNALEPAIVIDDTLGFSSYWRELQRSSQRQGHPSSAAQDFDDAHTWERVYYFAMHPEHETELFFGPNQLTQFVRQFALQRAGFEDSAPCIFTVFTTGAALNVKSPQQTGIWGAVRSLACELGSECRVDFRLVDVAVKQDLDKVPQIEAMREQELCVHNGRIWTSRLINCREGLSTAVLDSQDESAFRLTTNCSGSLADLEFETYVLPKMGPHDIEVQVKAAALNFRDIMVGLGRLPLLSYESSMLGRTIGIECSGTVVKCGDQVNAFKVGDRVVAMQGGCIANRIRCQERAASHLPCNLSFEQGSSVLSVYVTAYYALYYKARLRKGQTVLIHSGLGGVGQAAIALAKHKGARIFATAGSEEKRRALRDLGCVDAFDSHSVNWFPSLMEATNGKGVNIVLNSLAGVHVDLCLEALSPGGYHCEIGKVDIFADRPVKLAVFRKNLTYCALDIDRLMVDDNELVAELTEQCLLLLEEEKVPPIPTTVFSYQQYDEALRLMMAGHHRGKLVLTPSEDKLTVTDSRPIFGAGQNGDPRTVLLSGCFGGFGLRVLAYTIALGAKHILLLDRDKERRRSEEWVRENSYVDFLLGSFQDVRIEIVYADVSKYEDVVRAISEVSRLQMPPIGSVFHLAGVLDDKFVADIDSASFEKVYKPKANGAWNLHRATLDSQYITHFVMFSSASSAFGNQGQTNYSAANSYQDGLAVLRRQMGKPALSFCMGAVTETGMASRNVQLLQMMKASGMPPVSSIFAIEGLDFALRNGSYANSVVVLAKNLPADMTSSDFLRSVAQLASNSTTFKLGTGLTLSKDAIVDRVAARISTLCGIQDVSPLEPFSSYGLNSISVAELIMFLKTELSYQVSPMELMTSATCVSIAEGVLKAQEVDEEATAPMTTGSDDSGRTSTGSKENTSKTLLPRPADSGGSRFMPALREYFAESDPESSWDLITDVHLSASTRPSFAQPVTTTETPTRGESVVILPSACQEALDHLLQYVDTLGIPDPDPEVPVEQIKNVMITGATGFVGRHFLAKLLDHKSPSVETVYCPVRATDDHEALRRLIDSMKVAGTWNESYRARIRAFKGDLQSDGFGVSAELYTEIAQQVHAVYHFAASVNLSASFSSMRECNCLTFRPVARICLSHRRKHLFLASTLGMFPQYVGLFRNDMASRPILRDAMPDVSIMKRIFPMAMAGYSWSKLVVEYAAFQLAQVHHVPLAVFRLPVMLTNSTSGDTACSDPQVRLFFATMQLRMAPGHPHILLEDAKVCNDIMLRVSLNPSRRNQIFHCSMPSPSMPSECSVLDMMGLPCTRVTYESFKRRCQQQGENSSLHGYWILLDHFRPYWIKNDSGHLELDIDTSTVKEDCHPLPEAPNALDVLCSSLGWLFRHPNVLPFDVRLLKSSVDFDTMMIPARKLCAENDIGLESVIPPHVAEGLGRICHEVQNVPDAQLPKVAFNLTLRLETRLRLHLIFQAYPEIEEEPVIEPVFILGLNRTGTTFLHRLVEVSGCFETPYLEDQVVLPKVKQIDDPHFESKKLEFMRSMIVELQQSMEGKHEVSLLVAEEDMCAHSTSFASLEYDILYDLPQYADWVNEQSLDQVYMEHRRWMQYISWSRRRRTGQVPRRWCLKLPWHARSLPALMKVYPDALLVHTHRAPEQVAGSWLSLVELQRRRFFEQVDRELLGKVQVETLGNTLSRAMDFRSRNPQLEGRWLDVQFTEMITNPVDVACRVLAHAGIAGNSETKERIGEFVTESLKKRATVTKQHKTDVREYGVDPNVFDSDPFSAYRKKHF